MTDAGKRLIHSAKQAKAMIEAQELVGRLKDDLHMMQRDGLASVLATGQEAAALIQSQADEIAKLNTQIGFLKHETTCAKIGHEQLNWMIKQFDAAGFRGPHINEQIKLALAELLDLRRALKSRGDHG